MTVGKIELQQDERFQKLEWKIQRVGWTLWVVVIIAGLAGLLGGSGPLSDIRVVADDGSLSVNHQRFVHHNQMTKIRLQIMDDLIGQDEVRIEISGELLALTHLQSVQPAPDQTFVSDRGTVLVFPLDQTRRCPEIILHLEFEEIGRSGGTIGLQSHTPVTIHTIVYP